MTDAEIDTVAAADPPDVEEEAMAGEPDAPKNDGGEDGAENSKGKKRRSRKKEGAEPPPEEVAAASPEEPPEEAPEEPAGEAEVAEETSDAEEEPDEDLPDEPSARDPEELVRAVSALVFASPDPLTPGRMAALVAADGGPRPSRKELEATLETIRERLATAGLGLELRAIAGGWLLLTAESASDTVQSLFQQRKVERVTPAALETLAVIAYRQPVTKAEIEAIRGVQAGPILRNLVDRGFVKVTGRADQPGHPLQYGTTRLFLERFGLAGLGDLPRDGELARD